MPSSLAPPDAVTPGLAAGAASGTGREEMRAAGGIGERLLRERLRVQMLGRFLTVCVFLAAVVGMRLFSRSTDMPILAPAVLWGTLLALGLTLGALLLVRHVAALGAFAQLQLLLDVLLVTGGIAAVWRGVPGSAALLYFVAIANAAALLQWRGAVATALASSVAYFALLTHAFAVDPEASWSAAVGLPAALATGLLAFGAAMVGALADRVARAEDALARRNEDIGRLEGVQRALANDLECGVLVLDAAGRVRSANPAAQQILGLPGASTLGRDVHWLIPTLATAEQDARGDGGEIGFVECDLRGGDGAARRLRVKRTALSDTYGNSAGELVLLQDMTLLLELEERLARGEEVGLVLAESDGDGAGTSGEASPGEDDADMIGTCPAMRSVAKLIDKVSRSDATVLVTGESGTGKELVARAIHQRSTRAAGPFVVVNCGAIPESLIESELFGHVKGSFTGAVADRPGLFRRAHGGTIFLDEIGELPLNLQVRLLRVLQDHMVMPVGGSAQVAVDVRVVAATNRVLESLVKAGQFREDLYYRLAVIAISMPPLRERGQDVERLIARFVRQAAERHAKRVTGVSGRAMHLLLRHPYPGNVRELENVIEHATTLCEGETIREADLPDALREGGRARSLGGRPPALAAAAREEGSASPGGAASAEGSGAVAEWSLPAGEGASIEAGPDGRPAMLLPIDEGEGASLDDQLERREKAMLLAALARADGVKKRAATLLGINYRSFRHRLQKYGLEATEADLVPRFEPSAGVRERSH